MDANGTKPKTIYRASNSADGRSPQLETFWGYSDSNADIRFHTMAWPSVFGLESSSFTTQGRQPPIKPTILLCHDAFQTPSHFDLLAAELTAAGFTVLRPQLPSSSCTYRANALELDVQTLVEAARPEIQGGRNIVMVMSGYGALPGCTAAERLNTLSLDRPRAGVVNRLIFLSGIVVDRGQSYSDVAPANYRMNEAGLSTLEAPRQTLFNDCSTEVANWGIQMLHKQVKEALWTKVDSPGWSRIPSVYVVCELDQTVRKSLQELCVSKLRRVNGNVVVQPLQSGHAPFISRPTEVATLIARVASLV